MGIPLGNCVPAASATWQRSFCLVPRLEGLGQWNFVAEFRLRSIWLFRAGTLSEVEIRCVTCYALLLTSLE
jgi:hypothetical protein